MKISDSSVKINRTTLLNVSPASPAPKKVLYNLQPGFTHDYTHMIFIIRQGPEACTSCRVHAKLEQATTIFTGTLF